MDSNVAQPRIPDATYRVQMHKKFTLTQAREIVPYLRELGRAHRKFGVRERHYEVFRRALIATLQRFAAPSWNETAKHAWETAFNHAAGVMIDAARRTRRSPRHGGSPP